MADATQHIQVMIETVVKGMEDIAKNVIQPLEELKGLTKDIKETMRDLTKNTRSLNINMLALGFFGNMVAQSLGNLLKPAENAVGIFDIWNQILTLLFLPVMLQILPVLLDMLNWVVSMNEPTKTFIGQLVVIGTILGSLIAAFAFWSIGLSKLFTPLIPLFQSLTAGLEQIGVGIMSGIATPFLIIGAIIVAVVAGIYLAWKTNFGKIRDWVLVIVEGLKQMWQGFTEFFSGIWDVISGLLSGDSEKIVEGLKKIWSGFWSFLEGGFKAIIGVMVVAGLGLLRVLAGIVQAAIELNLKAIAFILDKLPGGNQLKKIVQGLKSEVSSFFEGLYNNDFGLKIGAEVKNNPKMFNDMIWRPGQSPVAISPNDTLTATKSGSGNGATVNITQNITANVSDMRELERMIRDNNAKLVNDVQRMVKVST